MDTSLFYAIHCDNGAILRPKYAEETALDPLRPVVLRLTSDGCFHVRTGSPVSEKRDATLTSELHSILLHSAFQFTQHSSTKLTLCQINMLTSTYVNRSYFFYPIGNTPAVNLLAYSPSHIGKQLRLLLLGCGDLRNVLFTLHAQGEHSICTASLPRINLLTI